MSDALLACRDCGQLHRAASALVSGHRLACVRCGRGLARHPPVGLEAPIALATTALILFLLVNAYPIFLVNLEGRPGQDLLISGPLRIAEYGGSFTGLGMLVAGLSFMVPLVWLCLVVIVLAGLRWGSPALHPRLAALWKTALLLYPWSMLDVYLLGAYVAYSRLSTAVETTVAAGGYALGALVMVQAVLMVTLGVSRIWDLIADPVRFSPQPGEPWIMCGGCQLVVAAPGTGPMGRLCPRCATPLEPRRPGSLSATLALISAGAILYLPANLLSVMTVERFGRVNSYTILSGVEELVHLGMWPLALLVFFASIAVPMLKLVSLGWFLFAIRRRSARWLRERTVLYRLIDFVGRWSNIDVFMVSILAASLQFGFLTTVDPEAGIISFAAVVVLTMLATATFDPRLMWDAARGNTR